jgi:DNA mismatch repair protein MutL
MPSVIRRLPEALASQIAAGEVVQHPASVVKELVENALDAGATKVRVFLEDAGKALVQVVDDGVGMDPEDALRCFERHATSKIAAVEDLFAIRTLGFRGEALAAISSVARVTLKTRPRGAETGTAVTVDAGAAGEPEPAAVPEGTSVAVRHLFYNVPARRHFLKSNTTEMRRVVDEFQRLALAHPAVAFELDHNGLELFRLPPANPRQRVVAVLGKRSNERLVPVEEATPLLRLEGFIGKPDSARKTRGEQFFFLNGRYFRSPYLHHAVAAAYEGLLPEGHHPLYVLFLDLDPARVDVNVHPTKQEVKFEDEKIVYAFLQAAARHALSKFSATPTLDFDRDRSFEDLPAVRRPDTGAGVEQGPPVARGSGRLGMGGDFGAGSSPGGANARPAAMRPDAGGRQPWEALFEVLDRERAGNAEGERGPSAEGPSRRTLTLPGTEEGDAPSSAPVPLHGRYVFCPIKSGFLLVDQRIAHERILYEKYRRRLAAGAGASQRELFPATLELGPADAATLADLLPAIAALGFDVQRAGPTTFTVHGTPADCAEMDGRLAVDELLEAFRRLEEVPDLAPRDRAARSLARSYAMPYGRRLAPEAARELIDALFACEAPYAGPDGQPTFLTFTLDELAARFRRR